MVSERRSSRCSTPRPPGGSPTAAARRFTIVSTLRSWIRRLEPWAYLRDLFCLLPGWPRHRVLELSPARWRETLEDEHTQERLAADVFRQVTPGAFDAQLALA